jgi:lipopolysaccharide exporter
MSPATDMVLTEKADIQKSVPKGRFAKDVLKLTSGTVLAQVISVLAAPLITRLFAPQAFGTSALFISIAGIISVTACLRYDRSIIVPALDQDAMNLTSGSLFFTLLISSLTVPFLLLGKGPLLRWLNAPNLEQYLWLVPLYVFFSGISSALYSWNTRKRHFVLITVSSVLASATYVVFAILAGIAGHTSGGYLIQGAFIGLVLSVLTLVAVTWRECWPALIRTISLSRMRQVLHRYRRFPRFSIGAAILNTVSWELPTLFLSAFFSPVVVGQYALGNRMIRIPMSFIGLNISRVFSQQAAQARHEGTLAPLVENTFQSLVTLGMFPFLLLSFIGKDAFGLVFGARWQEAGVYTEILSLWAFFWFASAPLSSVLDILDEQAFELQMNIWILLTRVLTLLVGGYLRSPRIALGLFAASGVFIYGYFCLAIQKKSGVPWSRPLRMLMTHGLKFIPYGAVILAAKVFNAPPLLVVALAFALLLIYYVGVIKNHPEVREMVYSLMRKPPQTVASETAE